MEVSQVPGGNVQGKTNIRNKNGHEWDWAWCWSSLHLFAGPAQSLWKPSGWRGSSAKVSGVAPPARMGEIKPQIAILLWFSFLHIAGRQRKGHWFAKHPWVQQEAACLRTTGRMWPMEPRQVGIPAWRWALRLLGLAARGNQAVKREKKLSAHSLRRC